MRVLYKYLYLFAFLTLTWDNNSQLALSNYVLRSDTINYTSFTIVMKLAPDSNRFIDFGVAKGRYYCYIIMAYNPNYPRGYSDVSCKVAE